MAPSPTDPTAPDADDEQHMLQLQQQLDRVPEPLQPLDVSAVDGFLCGLLLQPNSISSDQWLPCITDLDGRALPAGFDARRLQALVLRRHERLQRAIAARQWFDPWVFELQGMATVSECLLPWVAGFATAIERFPGLGRIDDARLLEPLALIYMHFDNQDLVDSDTLQQVIDTLEPPENLGDAVQDIVRSVMLLADVSRPVARNVPPRRQRRR